MRSAEGTREPPAAWKAAPTVLTVLGERRVPGIGWGVASALLTCAATLVVALALRGPLVTQDEAILLVFPERMLAGGLPHRDFFTVYGPGGYSLLATVYAAVGTSVSAERAVGLAYHLVLALGVLHLTRGLGRGRSLLAGVLAGALLVPLGPVAFAWVGGLGLVVWAAALLTPDTHSRRRALLSGLLAALAVSYRPELVVVAAAATAPLLWRRPVRAFATGFAAGLLPLAAFVAVVGREMVRDIVVGRMAVDARFPWDQVPPTTRVLLAVTVAAAAFLVVRGVRDRERTSAAMAGLAVAVLPQVFQRLDMSHLLFGLCVIGPCAFAAAWPASAGRVGSGWRPDRRGPVVAAGLALLACALLLTRGAGSPDGGDRVESGGRHLVVQAGGGAVMDDVLRGVREHAPAGSTLFVGAQDMSRPTLADVRFYFLLGGHPPAGRLLDLPAGVAEQAGSGLVQDVEAAQVLILTKFSPEDLEQLFPRMPAGSDEANAAVRRSFCPVHENAYATVLTRCR